MDLCCDSREHMFCDIEAEVCLWIILNVPMGRPCPTRSECQSASSCKVCAEMPGWFVGGGKGDDKREVCKSLLSRRQVANCVGICFSALGAQACETELLLSLGNKRCLCRKHKIAVRGSTRSDRRRLCSAITNGLPVSGRRGGQLPNGLDREKRSDRSVAEDMAEGYRMVETSIGNVT